MEELNELNKMETETISKKEENPKSSANNKNEFGLVGILTCMVAYAIWKYVFDSWLGILGVFIIGCIAGSIGVGLAEFIKKLTKKSKEDKSNKEEML